MKFKLESDFLPIPIWLIVVLFSIGSGAGLGLAFVITGGLLKERPRPKPWEDEHVSVIEPMAVSHRNKKPDKSKGRGVLRPKKADSVKSAEVVYNPRDKRFIMNMPVGPVKRAIRNGVKRLEPTVLKCIVESKTKYPKENTLRIMRFEFEAIGQMATINEVESLGKVSSDRFIETCLV